MFVIAFVEKLERDENNEKIRIRKKKVTMTIEEIHREMIKQDGGFPEARDENGEVFITPSAIRKYWPNHIGPMKERDKLMCGCADCIIGEENHTSLKSAREKLLDSMKSKITRAGHTRQGTILQSVYDNYYEHVMYDGHHHHERIWDATEILGCERHTIGDYSFPHFRCAIGECESCPEYKPHPFKEACTDPI